MRPGTERRTRDARTARPAGTILGITDRYLGPGTARVVSQRLSHLEGRSDESFFPLRAVRVRRCLHTVDVDAFGAGADSAPCGPSRRAAEDRHRRHRLDADLDGTRPDDD